jgi:hypothetical protein
MLSGQRGYVVGASRRSELWRAQKFVIRSRCNNPRHERDGDPAPRSGADGGRGARSRRVAAGALVVAAGLGQSICFRLRVFEVGV